jgi:hypothetical protein
MKEPKMISELFNLCKDKSWFSDVIDEQTRYVIYAYYINRDILTFVPQTFDDKQVVVHFANYRKAKADYWLNTANTIAPAFKTPIAESDAEDWK